MKQDQEATTDRICIKKSFKKMINQHKFDVYGRSHKSCTYT